MWLQLLACHWPKKTHFTNYLFIVISPLLASWGLRKSGALKNLKYYWIVLGAQYKYAVMGPKISNVTPDTGESYQGQGLVGVYDCAWLITGATKERSLLRELPHHFNQWWSSLMDRRHVTHYLSKGPNIEIRTTFVCIVWYSAWDQRTWICLTQTRWCIWWVF